MCPVPIGHKGQTHQLIFDTSYYYWLQNPVAMPDTLDGFFLISEKTWHEGSKVLVILG